MSYADKEKRLAYQKEYNSNRKESKKIYNKEYGKKNRKKLSAASKKWNSENPEKIKGYVLKRRYHITIEEYGKIFNSQQGCCAICGTHQSQFEKALHLDHCHKSKTTRGLLCVHCNTALGHLKENIKLLSAAIMEGTGFLNANGKKGVSKFNSDTKLLKKAIKYLTSYQS